jgi:hypothetical protein
MNDHIRPLVASRFREAVDRPIPGAYDATRQLRVNDHGSPVVAGGPAHATSTAVRQELPDPDPPGWLLDTMTKVSSEKPDDFRAMTDTETRTRPDPADPPGLEAHILPADDSVTGIVAF